MSDDREALAKAQTEVEAMVCPSKKRGRECHYDDCTCWSAERIKPALDALERRLATHDDARSDEGGVRVTCANGHTSTFRDLRDESDCTAPCCPRDGCDECSFTFEPSDLFDPMWGDVVFATPLAGGDDGG